MDLWWRQEMKEAYLYDCQSVSPILDYGNRIIMRRAYIKGSRTIYLKKHLILGNIERQSSGIDISG